MSLPERPVTAEKFLTSTGVPPVKIRPMVAWAKTRGYETATAEQWIEIFKSY